MHVIKQGDDELRFCSLHLIYQSDGQYRRKRNADVDLQDRRKSADYDNNSDRAERNELELDFGKQIIEEPVTCTLPIWTMSPRDLICGSSLLPYCYQCRYSSSQKGSQATADGKQVLGEMIEATPESSYEELSFKEFVREQQSMEEPREEEVRKEENRNFKSKAKMEQKNKNSKGNILSRSESNDSERFLLRVFYPVILNSKIPKASSTKSSSRMGGSNVKITDADINKGINRTDRLSSTKSSESRSTRSSSNPSRWSLKSGKCTPSRQRGCLFF